MAGSMQARHLLAAALVCVVILEASAFALVSGRAMCAPKAWPHSLANIRSLRNCRAPMEHCAPSTRMSLEIRAHSNVAEWVAANGGYVHPAVTLSDKGEAGVGLSLSSPVPAGQVLVAVPPRLQVTLSRLTGDEAVAVENEVPSNKWDFRLALALIALIHDSQNPAPTNNNKPAKSKQPKAGGFGAAPEPAAPNAHKRSSVEWKTYIETLPQKLDSLPVFFTGGALREFETEFPSMNGEVGGRVQLLKSILSDLPKTGAFAELTLRKFAWAYGIVSSRAVRLEGRDSAGVLLPMLDLANHDFAPSAEIRRLGQQKNAASAKVPTEVAKLDPDTACLVAKIEIEKGGDVTLSYGELSNAELLLEYGFRVDGNTRGDIVSPFSGGEGGALSADDLQFLSDDLEMNVENVDKVLDSVRPYLIADGGNCRVVAVDSTTGDVQVEMEGACGSCPSSVVTLKNGLERALQEAFGDRLGQVVQVSGGVEEDTLSEDVCMTLLAPVMGAVTGLGGVLSIVGVDPRNGAVTISYKGPEKLTFGIELTLKDDDRINTVTFV